MYVGNVIQSEKKCGLSGFVDLYKPIHKIPNFFLKILE